MRCRFVTDFRDFNPLPRKEGDTDLLFYLSDQHHFNPLPRKEGDISFALFTPAEIIFQSTPS